MSLTLTYDTETTGIWHKDLPLDHDAQPNLVQLAAILTDSDGKDLSHFCTIVRPEGWTIPHEVAAIHGINDHRARAQGVPLVSALALFSAFCVNAEKVVGHNLAFDINILTRSYWQIQRQDRIPKNRVCTMLMSKDIIKLPSRYQNSRDPYKFPNLAELHMFCFGENFDKAHTAMADATATKLSYYHLLKIGASEVPPRVYFIPPKSSGGSPQATNPDTRTYSFLKAVLEGVPVEKMGDWDKKFVTQHRARLQEYSERLFFSPKQWAQVERMATLYKIIPKKEDESAAAPKSDSDPGPTGHGQDDTTT